MKLTPGSSAHAYQADMQAPQSKNDQTARISLQISRNVKKQRKQNNPNRAISFVAPSKPSSPEFSQTRRSFRPAPSAPSDAAAVR